MKTYTETKKKEKKETVNKHRKFLKSLGKKRKTEKRKKMSVAVSQSIQFTSTAVQNSMVEIKFVWASTFLEQEMTQAVCVSLENPLLFHRSVNYYCYKTY